MFGLFLRHFQPLLPPNPFHDLVLARTHDGRVFSLLTVIDEYTRECLAIRVARQIRSDDVLELLAELFALRGTPEHLRSDNGPEFCAQVVRDWLGRVGVKTLFIEPGSPWGTATTRASTASCETSC